MSDYITADATVDEWSATKYVARERDYPFFTIDNSIIEHYAAKIGVHALAVYCYLAKAAGQSHQCYPRQAVIATALGVKRETVSKAIKTLVDAGLLEVRERWGVNHERRANLYLLLDACPPNGHLMSPKRGTPYPVSVPHPGTPKRDSYKKDNVEKDNVEKTIAPVVDSDNGSSAQTATNAGARRAPSYPDDFEAFWAQSPRKGTKMTAASEWAKLSVDDRRKIAEVLPAWRDSDDWNRERKYIKHMERWLKYRAFDDDPTPRGANHSTKPAYVDPAPSGGLSDIGGQWLQIAREKNAAMIEGEDEPW